MCVGVCVCVCVERERGRERETDFKKEFSLLTIYKTRGNQRQSGHGYPISGLTD